MNDKIKIKLENIKEINELATIVNRLEIADCNIEVGDKNISVQSLLGLMSIKDELKKGVDVSLDIPDENLMRFLVAVDKYTVKAVSA